MQYPRAKKKFGQNFLIDSNILNNIIKEISPAKKERIVEIGAGQGALTSLLANSEAEIISFEIDEELFSQINGKFGNVKIINEDFLKFNLRNLFKGEKLRIVGNIPYNITSPIIFKLIENIDIVKDAVFLIQKEVAQRTVAKTGSKDYGILSVILGYFAEVKIAFDVSPNVFRPKPKVHSSLIHIYFKEKRNDIDEKLFIQIVKAAFNYRRKTLKNSLNNSIFKDCDFKKMEFNFNLRAEELSVEDYVGLTKLFKEFCNGKTRSTSPTA